MENTIWVKSVELDPNTLYHLSKVPLAGYSPVAVQDQPRVARKYSGIDITPYRWEVYHG